MTTNDAIHKDKDAKLYLAYAILFCVEGNVLSVHAINGYEPIVLIEVLAISSYVLAIVSVIAAAITVTHPALLHRSCPDCHSVNVETLDEHYIDAHLTLYRCNECEQKWTNIS